MAVSCEERGYEATSVADLLRISGVSRATFYTEFSSKLDCFAKMQEETISATLARVEREVAEAPPGAAQVELALATLADQIAEQPASARACMLDAFAAGEESRVRLAEMGAQIERLLIGARTANDGESKLPPDLASAVSGGIMKVFQGRLIRGETAELPKLAPKLAKWLLTQEAPPKPLRKGRLTNSRSPSPSFAGLDPVERVLRATAGCIAEHGYPATTVAEIAARGRLSQRTFYEHFASKEEATIAALDSSGARMLAAILPTVRRTADWPTAVRGAFATLCGFLATEPDFAYLRIVETYSAGAQALEIRDRGGEELLAALLEAAPPEVAEKAHPTMVEMIAAAVYANLYNSLSVAGADQLPRSVALLTYLTLSPIIGAEDACKAANGDGRRR
jgi:AcrR family transcriptional regulator